MVVEDGNGRLDRVAAMLRHRKRNRPAITCVPVCWVLAVTYTSTSVVPLRTQSLGGVQALGTGQGGIAQVGTGQVRTGQVLSRIVNWHACRIARTGSGRGCVAGRWRVSDEVSQVGTAQDGIGQVGIGQVGSGQVSSGQVGIRGS